MMLLHELIKCTYRYGMEIVLGMMHTGCKIIKCVSHNLFAEQELCFRVNNILEFSMSKEK